MYLEQEYDAQTDMVDDQDPTESGPGPYPENIFPNTQQPMPQSQGLGLNQGQRQQQQPQQPQLQRPQQVGPQTQMTGNAPVFGSMSQLLDNYDPMLEFDPFGLSASMQFPTQFSFDTSSMR